MCLLPAALKKQAEEQNNTELPDKTRNVVTEKKNEDEITLEIVA